MSDAYGEGLGRERDSRGASAARRLAAEIIPKWSGASAANTMEYETALKAIMVDMVVKSRTRKKEQRPRTRTKTTEHGGRRFVCGAVRSGRRQTAGGRRTVCKHQRPTLGN